MRRLVFAIGMLLAGTSHADQLEEVAGWRALNGSEIVEALTGRALQYGVAWQDFRESGRTLYVSGSESWGYWAVRDDQYCSMWPPSDLWACYGMQTDGQKLRFVSDSGGITEGVYRE